MPKYMLIITPDTKLPNPVLIPSPPATGCPNGTLGCSDGNCPATCFCEDHCSWEKCTLSAPRENCLHGNNATWQWNSRWWSAKYVRNGKETEATNTSLKPMNNEKILEIKIFRES